MITFPIHNRLRYIPASNTFNAVFTGDYQFGTPGNTLQTVIALQENTVYYIDNYSVSGNIPKEVFLSSIAITPTIVFSRRKDKQHVYTRAIPVTHFFEEKAATVFVFSQSKEDALLVSFSGVLSQTADMIGINPLKITVSLSIYASDDPAIHAQFIARNNQKRI